jgi:uncharacterized cupin superfamily protein
VRAGDFIAYGAGDPTAHTFVNTCDEPLEFLATGNRVDHEAEEQEVFVETLRKTLSLPGE